MVSTVEHSPSTFTDGLSEKDAALLQKAQEIVTPFYQNSVVMFEQNTMQFVQGLSAILASMNVDVETRIAGWLFEWALDDEKALHIIEEQFGKEIATLVQGVCQLVRFHGRATLQQEVVQGKNAAQHAAEQVETLRKMLLAMASDIRVVLIRLASRLSMLRFFSAGKLETAKTKQYAKETLDLYSPLANRLGIWQMKWELEDLSFRFLEPETYKRIAKMLEEKRLERTQFVDEAITKLKDELQQADIKAEVSGRPKHIYSIWNKMRGKSLAFSELYDVRAFRVIVDDIKTCYTVLGIVHNIWVPLPKEFDDYISRPKSNGYQSLHTVVLAKDGRPLEVQIRTWEMHHFAEYGVAAHWRYKEHSGGDAASQKYNEKIAWLRQLLAWKSEVADAVMDHDNETKEWHQKLKSTSLDERIYVLTPNARVIELPTGSTPVDFAYHLHSDVGNRCRGAKVDGVMVPLNTQLRNGQTVEIITAKGTGPNIGPSRDWLNSDYVASSRARTKIRAWFNALAQEETLAQGRAILEKILQREGKTAVNLEDLARKLDFPKIEDLLLALGKDLMGSRQIEVALQGESVNTEPQQTDSQLITRKSKASDVVHGTKSGVLVVGTAGLLTQLARCCKPAPPDDISGFVTRGKGISIHRSNCKNFLQMKEQSPERVIQTTWGKSTANTVYPVDIFVLAMDRQGLLHDISDMLLREKINVTGVSTQSVKGQAKMSFTAEITSTEQLQKALMTIREVKGVMSVSRL